MIKTLEKIFLSSKKKNKLRQLKDNLLLKQFEAKNNEDKMIINILIKNINKKLETC